MPASERRKRMRVETIVDGHFIKCPICSDKCHMCRAGIQLTLLSINIDIFRFRLTSAVVK